MARFDFYKTEKYTILEAIGFSVEAETEEEARKIAAQMVDDDPESVSEENEAVDFRYREYIYDSAEPMAPEDNNGHSTSIVYWENIFRKDRKIADNVENA